MGASSNMARKRSSLLLSASSASLRFVTSMRKPWTRSGFLVVLDDDGIIPQPDGLTVPSEQPVLKRPARFAGREDPIVIGEDPLAIVGMEEL